MEARRDHRECEQAVEVVRRLRHELFVHPHRVVRLLDVPEHRSRDDRVDRMEAERKGRDDAEVAAAAPQSPEQILVLILAGRDEGPVGEHDVSRKQVVDAQATTPCQVSEPAAESQTPDSGRRHDAARRSKPERVRRVIDVAPRAAALDRRDPRRRVDLDPLHRGQIEDDAIVNRSEPGNVMPAAAYGKVRFVLARKVHDGDHVGDIHAPDDERRPAVDHRVVDGARLVVALVARPDQLPAYQPFQCRRVELDRDSAHQRLLPRSPGLRESNAT